MSSVLLFSQYFSSSQETPDKVFSTVPINLLCLASYLKERKIDCKIYELGAFGSFDIKIENKRVRCGLSDSEIEEILRKEAPKLVGIGCVYTRHYIDILSLVKLIKKVDPSIKVVVGGNHATSYWDTVLQEQEIDFVIRGEGEITFYELCKNILEGEYNYETIKGLAYKDNFGNVKNNIAREFISNLDDLPIPDYDLIDTRRYVNPVNKSPFAMRYPAIGIITSRGCPGTCIFCTVRGVWGRSWRGKSAIRTVDEIELLVKKYGVREIDFLDDSASLDKKRWEGICNEIIKRKIDVKWTTPNGIAHWTLDKELIRKMKKSGCYRITFGIESGNLETRGFIRKTHSLEQAKEVISYANQIGMWTISTNILGFPYEKEESMNDTLEFAKKSNVDFAAFYLLAPHAASDVYKYFKDEGLLDFDFMLNKVTFDENKFERMNKMLDDRGIDTKYFTADEMKSLQLKFYKSFIIHRAISYIINPLCILLKIQSFEDFRYSMRLIFVGIKLFLNSFTKSTTKTLLYE